MKKILNIIFFLDGEKFFTFYGGVVFITYFLLYWNFYTILISTDLLEI